MAYSQKSMAGEVHGGVQGVSGFFERCEWKDSSDWSLSLGLVRVLELKEATVEDGTRVVT